MFTETLSEIHHCFMPTSIASGLFTAKYVKSIGKIVKVCKGEFHIRRWDVCSSYLFLSIASIYFFLSSTNELVSLCQSLLSPVP
jgi:hypothetical protein